MNQQPPVARPQPGPAKPADLFKPWVTYALLVVTIFAFLVQYLTQLPNGGDLLMLAGEKVNQLILVGEWWRLVTPIFLHGSLMHILFNMYFLYVVGPSLERFYGRTRFALLYFLSGIAGNVASYYLTSENSVGASTALFGLVTANAVFVYRNRQFFGDRAGPMLRNTFFIVAANLLFGMFPGIDNWGHVGGLLGGLAFSWAAGPLLMVERLPGGGYRVLDENSNPRFWWVALGEVFVLLALVVVRMFGN